MVMRSDVRTLPAVRGALSGPRLGATGLTRGVLMGEAAPETGVRIVGQLFTDLRKALRLTIPEVAQTVGTRIDVVVALEAGVVHRLPPWPETARVVARYTGLAGIDPRPVLDVLRTSQIAGIRTLDLEPLSPVAGPAPPTGRPGLAPASGRAGPSPGRGMEPSRTPVSVARATGGTPGGTSGARRWAEEAAQTVTAIRAKFRATGTAGGRRLAILAALPLLIGLAFSDSRIAGRAASVLPRPMASAVLGYNANMLTLFAPRYKGLVWIDPADPRTRRGDKLPIDHR